MVAEVESCFWLRMIVVTGLSRSPMGVRYPVTVTRSEAAAGRDWLAVPGGLGAFWARATRHRRGKRSPGIAFKANHRINVEITRLMELAEQFCNGTMRARVDNTRGDFVERNQ